MSTLETAITIENDNRDRMSRLVAEAEIHNKLVNGEVDKVNIESPRRRAYSNASSITVGSLEEITTGHARKYYSSTNKSSNEGFTSDDTSLKSKV